MIRFDILTIFPEVFEGYFNASIIKRARERKLITIVLHNVREYTTDKHKSVDDKSYGGGAGMVLKSEPLLRAVDAILKKIKVNARQRKIILLSAKGAQYTQERAWKWSKRYKHFIIIAGRYEGIDERVGLALKAEEISIGPYVLTDGEVPAMAIVSSITRLLPGAITLESLQEESHFGALVKKEKSKRQPQLEYPQYTRPEVLAYRGKKFVVPKVLLSGDHKKINEWRRAHTQ